MAQTSSVRQLISILKLRPHPEGGFFRETYRSKSRIGRRNVSAAIFFLLPKGSKSKFHRINSDEIWHFYLGGPLVIVEIGPKGRVKRTLLGSDMKKGEKLQHVVPAGTWLGAYPAPGTEFSLVGCTVAPGFDFADFEMGRRDELIRRFPRARWTILGLT